MCPGEWRIAYSNADAFTTVLDLDGSRRVPLGYDNGTFSLPGRSYAGGVSYQHVRDTIELFQEFYPGIPPPLPIDIPGLGIVE